MNQYTTYTGENELVVKTKLKNDLMEFLSRKNINNVSKLWASCKDFAFSKNIILGGSYASFSDVVSLNFLIDGAMFRFTLKIKDLKIEFYEK